MIKNSFLCLLHAVQNVKLLYLKPKSNLLQRGQFPDFINHYLLKDIIYFMNLQTFL